MGTNEGDPVILVNASEIWPLMAEVPEGSLTTISEICKKVAKQHKVKGCCTLTTGIFIMSIANAVEEAVAGGDKSLFTRIPYWRTLKAGGFLNEKYPRGLEEQRNRLEDEGHKIIVRGKKYQVADYDKYLFKF